MPTQQEIDDFKVETINKIDNQTTRASIKRFSIGGFYRTLADWFSDIIIQIAGLSNPETTTGTINAGSPALTIVWAVAIVPGDTRTYLEKHGPLKDVIIQTERPTPNIPDSPLLGYYQQSLDSYKSLNRSTLIIDNSEDEVRYLIFSKGTKSEPTPPGENDYVDDYMVDDYVE